MLPDNHTPPPPHRRHEELSGELVDAFMSGDAGYVARCLRRLDCLEGEALDVFCGLLERNLKLKPHFPKCLKFAGWPRASPSSNRPRTPRYPPDPNIDALQSGDVELVSICFRNQEQVNDKVLDALARLFELDLAAKPYFRKCIKFAGWGRGRPPLDESMKEATHRNIRYEMRKRRAEVKHFKTILHEFEEKYKLKRSTLMKIWNGGKF